MAQFWWQQPNWWGGPVVDPGPDGPWPRPWPFPIPRPRPWPWPPWVDPAPDGGFGGFGVPGSIPRWPIPGDPAPWAEPEPSPWINAGIAARAARADALRWRPNVDPPPDDFRVRVDIFARWARDLLVAAGHRAETLEKATVRDLIDAFTAASTPAHARQSPTAVTAAQVAELDRDGLERLGHQLNGERTRLDELSKLVATRLQKESGK